MKRDHMRILFVTPYIPSLIRVRPYNILRALVERGHDVTLLTLQPPGDQGESLADLRSWGLTVHVVPHPRNQTLINGLRALPSRLPLQAAYSRSPQFARKAAEILGQHKFDVVHLEHLRGAVLAGALGDLPIVFDSVDSISLLFGKVLQDAPTLKSRLMAGIDLERTRRFEGQLTQYFRQVAVTSEADRQALIGFGCDKRRITVVPNGVDLGYFSPLNSERDPLRLVFTGKMSYHANVAAVEDLVRKIMPLVWKEQPDAKLQIVGKDPSPAVLELGKIPNVSVIGFVPDMRPYLAQAAIAISTVRYGVGIQNKVLEAMAMETPVVCSAQANSALKTINGQDILVGDTPQMLAQHILDLLGSADKRIQVGQQGRHYVETHHTWDSAAATLETLYQAAIDSHVGHEQVVVPVM
ncbi:MAG: glycosyltransferase [Anaerolineae bacterium]|nr:glycosyltransferase [Anaerolineae bacterium]